MRRVLTLAGLVLLGLALAGCGGPERFTLSGRIELGPAQFQTQGSTAGDPCAGAGGYADLAEGAPVTITNPGRKVIALGEVTAAALQGVEVEPLFDDGTGGGTAHICVLRFTAPKVPAGYEFYGVEVADRGVVEVTAEKARSGLLLSLS